MAAGALVMQGGVLALLGSALFSDGLGTDCCCGGGGGGPEDCNDCGACPATFVVQVLGLTLKHAISGGGCFANQTVSYDLLYPVTRTTGVAPYPPSDVVCAWIDTGKISGGTCPIGEETAEVVAIEYVAGTPGCEAVLSCPVGSIFERVSGLLILCDTFGGTPPKLGVVAAPTFGSCNPTTPACGIIAPLGTTWASAGGGVTILLDPCANTIIVPDVPPGGIVVDVNTTLLDYGTWSIL